MHSKEDENYERGYEWWLMVEAKKVIVVVVYNRASLTYPSTMRPNLVWAMTMRNKG